MHVRPKSWVQSPPRAKNKSPQIHNVFEGFFAFKNINKLILKLEDFI
jgi:hypothetical protein